MLKNTHAPIKWLFWGQSELWWIDWSSKPFRFSNVYLFDMMKYSDIRLHITKFMCRPQTDVQTRRRLTALLVSVTKRVVFFCRRLRWEGAASCLLPVVPRLHQAPQAPPWKSSIGSVSTRSARSVGNVVLSRCDTESVSFERNCVWAEKEEMDLSLSGDVSSVTVWKNLNQVCQLCCGPQVYFLDAEGYWDVFLELLKLEGRAVMLQGRHRLWKWDTGISLHSASVCLVVDKLRLSLTEFT